MLLEIVAHESHHAGCGLDSGKIHGLLSSVVFVNEVVNHGAIEEEIRRFLGRWLDQWCLVVDCIQAPEHGVVGKSHNLGIAAAIVLLGDITTGINARGGYEAERGGGPG